MSTKINDDSMSLEIGDQVIATAEFSEHAAADGRGAWIVSCHRLMVDTVASSDA